MAFSDYQTDYQVNPIVLVAGVAGTGMMALSAILSSNSTAPVTSDGISSPVFGQFCVLPGGTLMQNENAKYPLANMTVAANAIITNPLTISIEMLVPADAAITLTNKQAVITALKKTLDAHTAQGGYYNVATPSYIYQNCLLLELVDATEMVEGGQPQVRWVWEFEQPLITVAAAQAAQNQAMAKISSQTANAGDPPGSKPIVTGINDPTSNISPSLLPNNANAPAANVAPTSNGGVRAGDLQPSNGGATSAFFQ